MNTSNNLTPYEQKQEVINLLRLERVRLNFTAVCTTTALPAPNTPSRPPNGARKSTG
jgi:hypothetical protein